MSFFDEGDEPTRVRRPARPRRPATAARGGGAGAPPDRQTARTRQAVFLGIVLLVFILLAVGINSCRNGAKENALKDYNRNVTAVIKDSDGQIGAPFFQLLNNAQRQSSDLQVQVNQLRLAADEDLKRAKGFDVPGEMSAAHRNLELVLSLRAQALQRIAAQIPTALGRGGASQQAISSIAAQMQAFLASDVVYSQRVAPLIRDGLDKSGVSGQQISGSRFIPDISWLAPATVSGKLGKSATSSNGGPVAPGLHGHGLVSVTAGGVTLQPGGAVNRVVAAADTSFTVNFANQGDNDEQNVKVGLRVAGGGKNITQNKTIASTKAKSNATVTIPLGQAPPVGQAATVTVSIAPVPGEKNTSNNRSQYTVIFTR
ncbi:MAG: hypothetical protein ACXVFN_12240 [Solirubrobacteraceae bacterium]